MEGKLKLSFNKRLELAGIKIIREQPIVYLEFKGKKLERPWVQEIEKFCQNNFNLTI